VSQVADQYLAVLAFDELIRVTDLTLQTAQASYDLTRRQFEAGTGNELAVRQAQTVVQQAKANRAAQVRGRAQAENGLVLLLGKRCPPTAAARGAGRSADPRRHSSGPAFGPAHAPPRRDAGRGPAARRECEHRRGARPRSFRPSA
jgi:multidrug efflux system outer membrane protein